MLLTVENHSDSQLNYGTCGLDCGIVPCFETVRPILSEELKARSLPSNARTGSGFAKHPAHWLP